MTTENYFSKLAQIDCSEHVEKKGRFSYLSWAWAVKKLREVDPTATWEVKRFDGVPYLKTDCGYFVEVEVTVQGLPLSQIHPILNNQNKPIAEPNSFDINTSIQRCLVKAIALHGLGLYIYAGEDLPEIQEDPVSSQQVGVIKLNIKKLATLRTVDEDTIKGYLSITEITDLTKTQADEVIKKLTKWLKQAEKETEEQVETLEQAN
ncbi:Sak single strand annealing protein [Bacillus thuringiensis]|uniref:Sak single strand annealing protein n=1 Tax=Bacillus thuringiensis TaxID=1428 RepID=UPI0035E307AC